MWPTLLLGLLVASLAGWGITAYLQTRRIRRLERSHEEIQVEETLVFDFLHGLGEAFRGTIRPQELHRLIVEGAVRILDAHGGALYVMDRTGGKLMPGFISKGCPPLVDVPQDILQQAAATPIALETFLRLHTLGANEGLIGRVWQTGQAVCINEFSEAPELAKLRGSAFGSVSVMVTALGYGEQDLGVLAVANGPMSAPFSQADFVVFKSIAEQSAFALYNAIIYSMANEKKRLDHDLEIAASSPGKRRLFRLHPCRSRATWRRNRRRFRQRRACIANHGDLPQRVACRGRSEPLSGGCVTKSKSAALSRHQRRHVHQHGVPGPGSSARWRHACAGRTRRAVMVSAAIANCNASKVARNGGGN